MTKPSKQPPIICIGDIWEVGDPRLWLKLRPSGAVEIPPTLRGTGFVHIEPPVNSWRTVVRYEPRRVQHRWRNTIPSDGETLLILGPAHGVLVDPQGCGAVSVLYNGQVGTVERYYFASKET